MWQSMGQNLVLTGMVLSVIPIGDYDKRITLLSKERGKITAFARGARRPNSQLLAATNPFAFGQFELYEGRSTYNLVKAEITNYFRELTMDLEGFSAKYAGTLCSECKNEENVIRLDESTLYTMQYIITSSIEKLYTFQVSEAVLQTLERILKSYLAIYVDRKFKSLKVLEEIRR